MSEQESKYEYYRPVLPKSMQNRLEKLFSEFPDVAEAYDHNASKFVHMATIDLIRKEEELQLEKIKARRERELGKE
ncbi:MAG: hypothetical protein ACFE9L_12520 [Candidatus Hodarchaeota archaeon]